MATTAKAGERRPGQDAPEVPPIPRPEPELPGRQGQPPGREIPGIPAPRPESPGVPRTPGLPGDPNQPGEERSRR